MKRSENRIYFRCHSHGNTERNNALVQSKSVNEAYKLVYVFQGSGRVDIDGKCYSVSDGDSVAIFPYCSFVIKPGEDMQYAWLELSGIEASVLIARTAFSKKNPVLGKIEIDGFEDLYDIPDQSSETYILYRTGGCVMLLMSYYMEKFPGKTVESEGYVIEACQLIEEKCCIPHFGVKDVVDGLKIDRSYLYRLFMDEIGVSVVEYITRRRIAKAEIMLANSDFSVKDVAYSVGFTDQMYFSRVFKKRNGRTPTEFRKSVAHLS